LSVLVSVLTLIFAGLLIFLFVNRQSSSGNPNDQISDNNQTGQTSSSESDPSETKPTQICTSDLGPFKAESAQNYVSDLIPFLTEINCGYTVDLSSNVGVTARLDSYNFFTLANGFLAISHQPKEHQAKPNKQLENHFYEKITARLLADGLKNTKFIFSSMSRDYHLYSNGKIICAVVNSSGTYSLGGGDALRDMLGCTDVTTAEQSLAAMLPFAIAYRDSTGEWPHMLYSGSITDSKHAPYQRAELGGPNNVELFYRTSPNSPWVYFAGAQGMLACSNYNTDDLKKAFLGESCHIDGNISEVSL